jgi:hypothetical protein
VYRFKRKSQSSHLAKNSEVPFARRIGPKAAKNKDKNIWICSG